MRRSPLRNAFAAVMLLWFGLITAEPAILHSCPVHSGASSSHGSAHELGQPGRDAAIGEHAGHPASHARTHQAQSHESDAPEQHRCACIGDCSSGPSVSGLPAPATSPVESDQWSARSATTRDESAIVTAPAFLRPYANGPPGALRIA